MTGPSSTTTFLTIKGIHIHVLLLPCISNGAIEKLLEDKSALLRREHSDMPRASLTFFCFIRSPTIRILSGDILIICLRHDFHATLRPCELTSPWTRCKDVNALPNLSSSRTFDFLSPEWLWKVLVGANSPSLCPTISSLTKTGMNFFPLWTAKVSPMKSGVIGRSSRPRLDDLRLPRLSCLLHLHHQVIVQQTALFLKTLARKPPNLSSLR